MKRSEDLLPLPDDFTGSVLARLPRADAARKRRRRMAALSRPAVAVLLGLVSALAGATALPAYGAEGARVAVRAVSWLMVGQSIATNLSASLIEELRLGWLPIATALLVLATVGLGAERRMRRSRMLGEEPPMMEMGAKSASSAPPAIDGRNALISLLALVVLTAGLVPAMALGRGAVEIGTLVIGADETRHGTTLVLAGDALVLGRTDAPLIVVGGDARVEGHAGDDVVAVLGNVKLGTSSVAGRDVVAAGGRVLRADGALVLGNVAGQELRWTGSEIRDQGDFWHALVVRTRLTILGAAAGMLGAIGAVTLVPWLVVLTAATGRGAPLQSSLIGFAGLACGPLVILPLALSLVGVPLAGILAMALVFGWWLGAAAVGFLLGRRLLARFGTEGSLTRATLLGGALLGGMVGIPVVGGVFLVLAGAAGAGAVLLALIEGEFGSVRGPESTVGMMAYE
jgi:hypothetical protein